MYLTEIEPRSVVVQCECHAQRSESAVKLFSSQIYIVEGRGTLTANRRSKGNWEWLFGLVVWRRRERWWWMTIMGLWRHDRCSEQSVFVEPNGDALRSVIRLEFWRRGANRSRYRVFGWWRGKAILLWLELIQHVVCQMVLVGLASSLANQMLTMTERERWRRRRHTDSFSCVVWCVCVFWDFLWCADETVKTHFAL